MAKKNENIIPESNVIVRKEVFTDEHIRQCIFTIRGVQVMVDRDLATFYDVSTSRLNEQVKRNVKRFPQHFRFQLTETELSELIAKCDRFKMLKHSPFCPYAFTEQGVSQLSSVLKSERAINVSIQIIDAFVTMRRYIAAHAGILQRIDTIETRQLEDHRWQMHMEKRFDNLLNRLDDGSLKHKLGIFFENQMFDAFVVVEELAKRCKKRLILIDDYVDGEVLERFRLRAEGATVDVYVQNIHQTSAMKQAFEVYHRQYPNEHVELHTFNLSHDRWMIVDDEVYHFGASIKDLGKKWFEVSRITEYTADELIVRIN